MKFEFEKSDIIVGIITIAGVWLRLITKGSRVSEIVQGQVGPELKYDIKFEGGKLVVLIGYDGADADAEISLKMDASKFVDLFIDKLEGAIPGDQKAIADMLKLAIASVMK